MTSWWEIKVKTSNNNNKQTKKEEEEEETSETTETTEKQALSTFCRPYLSKATISITQWTRAPEQESANDLF